MRGVSIRREKGWVFYLACSVSILLLIKVFCFEGCYSFDSNDDVNHTFVNLKAARDSFKQGSLPELNLYNNFGTPLMGDALTFPFSLQSLTYWILPDHLAMTVNRTAIAFLTIFCLCLFLRQFLSRLSCLVCSLLIFFSPGQFWNLAHHHYQMSLLCVSFMLFIQSRSIDLSKPTYVFFLWFIYVIFFLSVSIQLVVIAVPFLLLFLVLAHGYRAARCWVLNLVAFISAVVATWPHTILFFKNISGSTRAQWSPYSGILTTLRDQVLALIVAPGEWMHYRINGHFSIATYFSVAYLMFATLGVFFLFRKSKASRRLVFLVIGLGVFPAVSGFLLQFYGQQLPFVRSVDSTRIWWFSNIFLALAVGRFLDTFGRRPMSIFFQFAIGCSVLVLAAVYFLLPNLVPELAGMSGVHHLVWLGTIYSLLLLLCTSIIKTRMSLIAANVGKSLAVAAILLALIPTIVHVMGLKREIGCNRGNHYFAKATEATFQPAILLESMQSGSRMASEESPVEGHDLKAIFGGVLGSNGRAIVSSQKLMEILARSKLITLDDNYFFSTPWQTDKLSRLGIRYLLVKQPNNALEKQGWTKLAEAPYLGQKLFLYGNPSKPTLIHLVQNDSLIFINSYQLIPNGITIQLPELNFSGSLVASFFRWDSWHAWVDGLEVIPTANDLGMLQIPVRPGDRLVKFKFQRLRSWDFLFSMICSIAIVLCVYFIQFLPRKRT